MTCEMDDYSLAQLGRAITFAPRHSGVHVWRTFVRTRDLEVAAHAKSGFANDLPLVSPVALSETFGQRVTPNLLRIVTAGLTQKVPDELFV